MESNDAKESTAADSVKSSPGTIPSINEMKKIMRSLSESLYSAWKAEIGERLRDLEFDGYISKEHIDVPDAVWRLPNDEVRYALCKLEEELESLGYDYEFKFDGVDDVHWLMYYSVVLPDRDDHETNEDELYNDDRSNNVDNRTIDSAESDADFAY